MELRQLRHFVAVAELHNYERAARRVNLSQPALTRSIKTLEAHLGVTLLQRGPKGTVATAAGERFLEYARLILSDCQRAREGLRSDEPVLGGRVTVGVAALFGAWITDEVVARTSREHPGVRLEIIEGCYEDMLRGLTDGRFDFAFTNIPAAPADREIVTEPLLTLDAMIACGARHPLARSASPRAADLAGCAWVIINHPHSVDQFRQYFIGQGLTPPPFVATNSLALLRSLIVAGTHLSMLCEPVIRRELARGSVRGLRVDNTLGQRRAGLLYLRRAGRPSAIECVMRIVRECSAAESAAGRSCSSAGGSAGRSRRTRAARTQGERVPRIAPSVTPAESSVPL